MFFTCVTDSSGGERDQQQGNYLRNPHSGRDPYEFFTCARDSSGGESSPTQYARSRTSLDA